MKGARDKQEILKPIVMPHVTTSFPLRWTQRVNAWSSPWPHCPGIKGSRSCKPLATAGTAGAGRGPAKVWNCHQLDGGLAHFHFLFWSSYMDNCEFDFQWSETTSQCLHWLKNATPGEPAFAVPRACRGLPRDHQMGMLCHWSSGHQAERNRWLLPAGNHSRWILGGIEAVLFFSSTPKKGVWKLKTIYKKKQVNTLHSMV